MNDWSTNYSSEDLHQKPLMFQEYLAKGYFDDCEYFTLVLNCHDKSDSCNTPYLSFAIPNFADIGEEVLIYQHTLYVYSDIAIAQKRADILGKGIKPVKLSCLHCFFSEASKQRPFIDVILNEEWHLELFSCRDSSYTSVSHVRVSTPQQLHQLEGCKKTDKLKWVEYPSYGVPNHPIEYCRPVPFPDKVAYLTTEQQGMTYSTLLDPEEVDMFIVGDFQFIALEEQDDDCKNVTLYSSPVGYLAFADIQDMHSVLTRGEGVFIPVATGILGVVCKVFPWAEQVEQCIQYFYNEGYMFTRSGLCRGVDWYLNAIMYELNEMFGDNNGINTYRESLITIDTYISKAKAFDSDDRLINIIERCLKSNIKKLKRLYLYDRKNWEENNKYSAVVCELKEKAQEGDAEAQFLLAKAYHHGRGTYYDMHKAVKWYLASAQQGFFKAQHNLGMKYFNGDGVNQNIEEAVFWLKKAACQGSVYSQFKLGIIYMQGQGVDVDLDQAVKWFTLASQVKYPPAQNMLGYLYMKGMGIPKVWQKAVQFLN